VIDTKCWADPRVEDGRLLNGEASADDEVDKLLRLTELVEQSVAEVGLPPLEVLPVLVFAGRKGIGEQLGRVQLLGLSRTTLSTRRRPCCAPVRRSTFLERT